MPFDFDTSNCDACPAAQRCNEDLRLAPVRGRSTLFRLRQDAAVHCTFDSFMPGTDNDANPLRTYQEYLDSFMSNTLNAGMHLYGGAYRIESAAKAKVNGDVFELLEAGALWAAAAAWNQFMNIGTWSSTSFSMPPGAVATPTRKVAIVKLPRGYDATLLFTPAVRNSILAHESALRLRGMELGLSSPDIVGVRLPYPTPPEMDVFNTALTDLASSSLESLQRAYQVLEGKIDSNGFLFAIAVKTSTRSDRLYQPLFEANVLKYMVEHVLRGAAFRFYAHLNDMSGSAVAARYNAASLISLIRGGNPTKAVDVVYHAEAPRTAAQSVLNDLPLFP